MDATGKASRKLQLLWTRVNNVPDPAAVAAATER